MKIIALVRIVVAATAVLSAMSCTTRPNQEQWKDDQTRFDQQSKRYPDRESRLQEKAEAEADRKARALAK
jgi:hypothetical protein